MEGDRVPKVDFREGDLLTEFETTFNDFLAYYDQQRTVRMRPVAPQVAPMTESQARSISSVLTAPPPPLPTQTVAAGA
jgi:hypothetical protein